MNDKDQQQNDVQVQSPVSNGPVADNASRPPESPQTSPTTFLWRNNGRRIRCIAMADNKNSFACMNLSAEHCITPSCC